MKLVSWNVNGIRAAVKKGFASYVLGERPDVLCLQEVRATQEEAGLSFEGYRIYWNAAEKKGYSGTAVLTRTEPLSVQNGIGRAEHDNEGRVITAEFPDYYLVNVYTPNAQRALTRLAYRTEQWDVEFLKFLQRLERRKPVVFCGDLNAAHKEIDLANPKANVNNAGFTPQERASLDRLAEAGFIDTFREFESGGGHYTWWSQMNRARQRNIGWRIDYFWVSEALRPRLKSARIAPHVMGSDHCPVALELHGEPAAPE
ncbi:MAG: exodeoxyribonuclease III [SAR324 cluster bacterium]